MSEQIVTEGTNAIGLMLITANVGSLFEDPKRLLKIWLKEFTEKVYQLKPKFIGLHLQEVGGKTYEQSMEYVQEFIRSLCDAENMKEYTIVRIYMDEDFKSAEYFTALGNMYFAHKELKELLLWNFLTHGWEVAIDKCIYSGNIETIPTKEKSKFPQHFFPECKWSRKGFMRTRWKINGTVVDLVNIHLFHDASNLAACEEFPSVYCKTRRRALVHTIERLHLDKLNGLVPFFIFGDFNFRCDTEGVVKELTENLSMHRVQGQKSDSTKIHYRNSMGNNVLTLGKKEFNHADHQLKFKENWLKQFDKELEPLSEVLVEYPITFAPSYPYEEDPEMPTDYMSTRCPAWCDRILMSPLVKNVINNGDLNYIEYNIIGENVCMGDHKPVYLRVLLQPDKGTYTCNHFKSKSKNKSTPLNNPAVNPDCPYANVVYRQILAECWELNCENGRTDLLQISRNSLIEMSISNVSIDNQHFIKSETIPKEEKGNIQIGEFQQKGLCLSKNNPPVSINITDSDNINICMCAHLLTIIPASADIDGTICPECRNIIQKQPIEHRYRLISKRLVLSENVIVNRIDTQHLSTYCSQSHGDPYTPESNESHSPYPELNSNSTSNSSNSRSLYDERTSSASEQIVDSETTTTAANNDENAILQGAQRNNLLTPKSKIDAIDSKTIEHCDIIARGSRGVVSPGQLISRLEDLQRLSMQKKDQLNNDDEVAAGKSDVGYVCESPVNHENLIECPENLNNLIRETVGDEIIWKEQSHLNCPKSPLSNQPKQHYIKVKPISTDESSKESIHEDYTDDGCGNIASGGKNVILKETTV